MHSHKAREPSWIQIVFRPQGDGWQGSGDTVSSTRWTGVQYRKASPVKPWGHVHTGIWLTTEQMASTPHTPGQGSWHLLLTHALFITQSELPTHSGRQASYGFPWYSGIHSHTAFEPSAWQLAFTPHGDG